MAQNAETIKVEIDIDQYAAQKHNNYSLFLAKKVNGKYTVIWQSKGAKASATKPSYGPRDTFSVNTPNFEVNYTNELPSGDGIKISATGVPVTMGLDQTVALDDDGVFGSPAGGGKTGSITVENKLGGNPHEILSDTEGNPIFVNKVSGMDIGEAVLTPIDQYQIWFDNKQKTGTMISHNASKVGEVTFDGSSSVETISYTADGEWVNAPLPTESA